jgi:exosortase
VPFSGARLPSVPRRVAATAGLVVAASLVYGPVLAKMVRDWWFIPDYSHGLICAPLALGFAWSRREELRRTPPAPRSAALLGVVAALALLLLGTLGAELFLTRISFLLFVASTLVFVAGWRHLRILIFPFALLLVSVPIPAILMTRITLPLQFAASSMAETVLTGVGIPVLREGNVLVLPNATLQVAEACSGIRSLVSLMTMALVIARFADHRWYARVAIVLAGVPVAIAVNGLRVAITSVATYSFGPKVLEGIIHEAMGWLMFLLALGLLAACARAVAMMHRRLTFEVAR